MTFEIACLLHVFKNRDRRFCLLSRFFGSDIPKVCWMQHGCSAENIVCPGSARYVFSASVRNIPVRLDVEGKIRVFRLHFLPDVREQAGRIRKEPGGKHFRPK